MLFFSVSLPDDSFLLPVLRKIGKMFLYIFQQSVLLPPRLSSAKLPAANQNYEERRDMARDGCRLQLQRQVKGQRIDRHPQQGSS